MNQCIFRAIDANFNRCREGLRVCEDLVRFILNDKNLTRRLKTLRHDVEDILNGAPQFKKILLSSRDVGSDVGKEKSAVEVRRKNARDIFDANIERSKESVRALEEFFKLADKKTAARFQDIRFRIYNLEKDAFEKLETLRNIR